MKAFAILIAFSPCHTAESILHNDKFSLAKESLNICVASSHSRCSQFMLLSISDIVVHSTGSYISESALSPLFKENS